MTETTGVSAQQDENQRAFLRYLPKRIAAFERRILRYRIDGWDPGGMSVLSGDVRRLADASGHYELIETHRHLLMLAEMVGEHFTSMRAPDPQQVKRMFALLAAVSASVVSCLESQRHQAPVETAHDADATLPVPDAPVAEAIAPAADASIATHAPVEVEEPVALVDVAEPTAPDELIEQIETVEPIEAVEAVAAVEAVEPVELTAPIEQIAHIEPAATVELVEVAEQDAPAIPAEPVEPSAPVEPVAHAGPAALVEPVATVEPAEPDESDATDEVGMRRVYHLSDGNAFSSELGQRLESEGYAVEPVESVDELSELLTCLMPQLLLVDASHVPHLAIVGALRRDAQQHAQPQRHIQMVVMAAQDNMETRRAAHRAGVDLLLFPPFDTADLSTRLQALHSTMAAEKVRVLIVDDNRADALFAQTVLTRAGIHAEVERDPMQVLESLKSQRPDLVLMDLHMPFVNGVEVTMLIREHPLFARLPIVFLSGESDPDSRLEAINAGGDDFLFKPIRPKHLIAAVQDRVRRMHPVNRLGGATEASDIATGT